MTEPGPLVSVILPTFNRMAYLPVAVQSVLDQTCDDWELLVIDDGSTDETQRYVSGLQDARIRLICLEHTGNPSRVRNTGIRHARGRYIAFLDSDDLWTSHKLAIQVPALQAAFPCRWSYTRALPMDESGTHIPHVWLRPWVPHDGWILEALIRTDAAVAMDTVIAERELLQEVGGFDETLLYAADYELWHRLALRSPVTVHPAPTAHVRIHAVRHSLNDVAMHESWERIYAKTSRLVPDRRLQSLCTSRRLHHVLALSRIYSARHQPTSAFRILFRSCPYARRYPAWWLSVARAMIRPFVPIRLLRILRRVRYGRSEPSGA